MTEPIADDDDDDTLRALGRHARARVEARPRAWEAVARGERSVDEVAAERLAAGDAPETVALARELFRPPDEAEHDALMTALLADRAAAAPEPAPPSPPAPVVLSPAARASAAANDSGRRPWRWVLVAAAAVVALAWWLVPGRPGPAIDPDPSVIALAPLPAYALDHDGGLTTMRGPSSPSPGQLRYRPGSRFEWTMRPAVAVEGEVAARLFAFGEGTATSIPSEGLVQVSPAGAVRVAGPIDALGLSPGAWTIAVVVGRPSALPSDPAAVKDGAGAEAWPEAWTVQRLALVLED